MIVVMITGLLATLSYPTYSKARHNAWRTTCQSNLRQIQNAIDIRSFDHPHPGDITFPDLEPHFKYDLPACPAGGTYSLNLQDGQLEVECDYGFGHEL